MFQNLLTSGHTQWKKPIHFFLRFWSCLQDFRKIIRVFLGECSHKSQFWFRVILRFVNSCISPATFLIKYVWNLRLVFPCCLLLLVRILTFSFGVEKLYRHGAALVILQNREDESISKHLAFFTCSTSSTIKFEVHFNCKGESCGLAGEHSAHDRKAVGSIPVQSNARW